MNAAAQGVPLVIAPDHPAFAGHFPGRPIVPGVVLLAEAIAVVAGESGTHAADWTVESCKFLAPVGPGACLAITHHAQAAGRVRFEIRDGAGVVATGSLSRAAGAP